MSHEPPDDASLIISARDPDGREIRRTVFRPVTTDEVGVQARRVPEGQDPPSEVLLEFAPSEDRSPSYPEELPFLPGVSTFTTVHPDRSQPPSARWRSPNREAAVASLVEQSEAAGWSRSALEPALPGRQPTRCVVCGEGRGGPHTDRIRR